MRVYKWDGTSATLQSVFKDFKGWVTSVHVLPDQRILAASYDATQKIFDAETGAVIGVFAGHEDSVLCAAVIPGGTHIMSCGADHTLRLWNWKDFQEVCSHKAAKMSALLHSTTQHLVCNG